MSAVDLVAVSPAIALTVLAMVVIVLDLVVRQKQILIWVSVLGLIVPALLLLNLAVWPPVSVLYGTAVVDSFSVFFQMIFLLAAALVILGSADYIRIIRRHHGEFYALILMAVVGMMLIASSVELISLYIGLEITALTAAALASFLKSSPKSGEAGLKFLLLSGVSSAVLLYGMALLYGLTGTTDLAGIAKGIAAVGGVSQIPFFVATALIVTGLGFKIAAVPFQMWAPDVYEGAPTPVTAFLSVASKSAGFAFVLRLFFVALAPEPANWAVLFAILAALSMTVGNVVAIAQSNVKRMLAYSSIAHAGYVLVGVASATALGTGGVLFYLFGYTFTNLAAFIAVLAISMRVRSDKIEDYAGIARRSPALAFGFSIALLSLIGIPPTAGFVGKFGLFTAAVNSGLIWLAIIGVLNSAISAYYYLRLVKVMYFNPPVEETPVAPSPSVAGAIAAAVLGVVLIGLFPAFLFLATQTASQVFAFGR